MTETTEQLQEIWDESVPFKQFVISYITMLIYPKKSFRFMNFAARVITTYGVDINDEHS